MVFHHGFVQNTLSINDRFYDSCFFYKFNVDIWEIYLGRLGE